MANNRRVPGGPRRRRGSGRFSASSVLAVWACAGLASAQAPPALAPPLPVWPSDYETITERQPVFRLNGRHGAARYRVEADDDPSFATPETLTETRVADAGGIEPVVLAPWTGPPLAHGRHYWRAFCAGPDGVWTAPANWRVFDVAPTDRDAIPGKAPGPHPRLLLDAAEARAFPDRAARSERLRRGWQYQLNAALGVADLEPPAEAYARAGEGQHGNYSTAAVWYHRHLTNVALAALVTRDDRLAQRGVAMLMAACAYERWLGPLFDDPKHFNPPWRAALETAMMTEAVAMGYDLLYAHLTEDQRETVRTSLVAKGIRPLVREWADPVGSSRLPRHQTPTGNWVMVCCGSAGVGALALLGEHPEAPEWVRLVRNRVRAWLHDRGGDWFADNPWPHGRPDPIPVIGPSEPNFGVDGGYKESLSYMNYAMVYVCYFADALRRATGENLFEHVPGNILEHLAWSHLAAPDDGGVRIWTVDFGDCWRRANYVTLYAALMKHRRDGRAAWLYRRTAAVPVSMAPLLWADETIPDAPPDAAVPMAAFRGIGQAVLRAGWSSDAPVAAIKFHQNRGHHDLGTFYLFGHGRPVLADSGPAPYGTGIYREYSSTSVAHNVVMVDDRPQARVDGRLLGAVATSRLAAASGDLTAAYPDALRSWTRDLVMAPGGPALVFDRLEGQGPRRFDLVLHPEPPFETTGPGTLTVGTGAGAAFVSVLSDGPFATAARDGYYMTVPRRYVRFDSAAPADRRAFLTVCGWDGGRAVETAPGRWRFDRDDAAGRLAVRIGGADDGPVTTDARVAAVLRRSGAAGAPHALVLGGTRLDVDGQPLVRASAAVHAAVEVGPPLRAHVWAAADGTLGVAAPPGLRRMFVDGVPVDAVRDGALLTFRVPPGEHRIAAAEGDTPPPLRAPRAPEADLPAAPLSDAPAFRAGMCARASSTWTSPLDAIDDDPNTFWAPLPGAPLPQWLEVEFPAAERVGRITVTGELPCAGHVETWDAATSAWTDRGGFELTPDRPDAAVAFPSADIARLRVRVDRLDPPNTAATITAVRWEGGGQR